MSTKPPIHDSCLDAAHGAAGPVCPVCYDRMQIAWEEVAEILRDHNS